MARPAMHDIEFTRGNDFEPLRIAFKDNQTPPQPLNYSTMTFAAQIRNDPDSSVAVPFTVDATNLGSGVLLLGLDHTVTDDLRGSYVWDLLMIDGAGKRTTLIAGSVFVRLNVTKVA